MSVIEVYAAVESRPCPLVSRDFVTALKVCRHANVIFQPLTDVYHDCLSMANMSSQGWNFPAPPPPPPVAAPPNAPPNLSMQGGPVAVSGGPPPLGAARLNEILEAVKIEFDGIVHDNGALKSERQEFEANGEP